jgi:hypothetical protein
MKHLMMQTVLCLGLCPLLTAQQPTQIASTSAEASALVTPAASTAPRMSALEVRYLALKVARTIHIDSQTMFLTVSTMERALMNQKDWERLDLNIVNDACCGDLVMQINRVKFTHIHTYILTDRATGMVLASGRVRALDGVIASGPMAGQIVKILSAARLSAQPNKYQRQ